MACFTLDGNAREFLAQCIDKGMEHYDTDETMDDLLAPIIEELQASDKTIEITIMVGK